MLLGPLINLPHHLWRILAKISHSICLSCYLPVYKNTGTEKHVKWHCGDANNQILTAGNATKHNQFCQRIKMKYFYFVLGRSFWVVWVSGICWFKLKPPSTRRNHSTAEAGRGQTAHLEAAEWSRSVFREPALCLVGFGDDWFPSWETPINQASLTQRLSKLWSIRSSGELVLHLRRRSGPTASLRNQSVGAAAESLICKHSPDDSDTLLQVIQERLFFAYVNTRSGFGNLEILIERFHHLSLTRTKLKHNYFWQVYHLCLRKAKLCIKFNQLLEN